MRWEEALKIKQNWTAEQARNDLERLIITGERPADKVVGLACKALDKQIPQKIDNIPEGDLVAGCHRCGEINALWKPNGDRCSYCGNCGQKIDWSETDG